MGTLLHRFCDDYNQKFRRRFAVSLTDLNYCLMVLMFPLYYVIQVSYTNSYYDVDRGCDCIMDDADCWTCHEDFCTPDKEDDDGGKSDEDDWSMPSTGSAAKTSVSVIAIALICLVIKA